MTIIDLIGNTPLVEIQNLNPNPNVRVFAKMEGHNPGGSVKDRPALNIIRSALDRGELKSGMKIIEATSGNTGIALAMIAAYYRIPIELVLPKNSTIERTKTMEAFGANVILLDTIEECRDFVQNKENDPFYYIPNQFSNPDNYWAHFKTTGPEIWKDTQSQITHFVSSMGTTGTIMGTSMFLKPKNPKIQIVGCQPTENSSIPGIRRWSKEYIPQIFDASKVDLIEDVSEAEAIETTRKLARNEGIFTGMSGGGAAAVALRIAERLSSGVMVFIACDRGDRYLSSHLFE